MGVRSMTGFGNAQRGGLAAEVRSVNHRNLDVRLQLPDGWGGLVADLTQQLKAQAHRGSVTLRITQDVEAVEEVALADVDRRVQRWHRVAAHMGRDEEPPLSWVLSGLGRTAAAAPVIDELTALVHESLSEWNAQRAREGAVLERQLRALLAQMRLHLEAIERAPSRVLCRRRKTALSGGWRTCSAPRTSTRCGCCTRWRSSQSAVTSPKSACGSQGTLTPWRTHWTKAVRWVARLDS